MVIPPLVEILDIPGKVRKLKMNREIKKGDKCRDN